MSCHLVWYVTVGCPLRGAEKKKYKKGFWSTKNNSGKENVGFAK
jgi:hypothetical protein